MSVAFHELTVASYLQIGDALAGVLDKGAAHCADHGMDTSELADARIAPDMADLRFQVFCVAHHSLATIHAFRSGEFGPPSGYESYDYAGLQKLLGETLAELRGLDPEAVNALADGNVTFRLGERAMPFTNRDFALTFSLPNFYFHATTAYDLLRMKGVKIGKRDFLGQLRMAG